MSTFTNWFIFVGRNCTFYYIPNDADIALEILRIHPSLAIARDGSDANGETPLHVLAKKPLKSYGSKLGIWSKCCDLCKFEFPSVFMM